MNELFLQMCAFQIPASAVEMPDDSISSNVISLDVQFGCLEFGSDTATFDNSNTEANNKFSQPPSSTTTSVESSSLVGSTGGIDASTNEASLNAYNKTTSAASSQQASLVSGLTGKGVSAYFYSLKFLTVLNVYLLSRVVSSSPAMKVSVFNLLMIINQAIILNQRELLVLRVVWI